MIKKIAILVLMSVAVIFTASEASAQTQTQTNCTASPDYGSGSNINCTSDTTQTGPTAAEVEQQKEINENAAKMGSALGSIIAMKRAQHEQEKNDLTAVTFCRQNPYGTWTFPNKAPMPCATLERNVTAYCSVNGKKPICKDVVKLPPVSAQTIDPEDERVTVNVVYCQQNPSGIVTTGKGDKQGCSDEIAHVKALCTVREWKGKPCEALLSNKSTTSVPTVSAKQAPTTAAQAEQNVSQPQLEPQAKEEKVNENEPTQ